MSRKNRKKERSRIAGDNATQTRTACEVGSETLQFCGEITYFKTLASMDDAITQFGEQTEVGFDAEYRSDGKVALVQVCFRSGVVWETSGRGYTCLLFHIHHNGVSSKLREFLENPGVRKVGVGTHGDVCRLRNSHGVELAGWMDVANMAAERFTEEKYSRSLEGLAAKFLGLKLSNKPCKLGGGWTSRVLSEERKTYAAKDAFAALRIYEALQTEHSVLPQRGFGHPEGPPEALEDSEEMWNGLSTNSKTSNSVAAIGKQSMDALHGKVVADVDFRGETVYLRKRRSMNRAVKNFLESTQNVVGLDAEVSSDGKVTLVQICFRHAANCKASGKGYRCLLMHTAKKGVSQKLRGLLENAHIQKVGLGPLPQVKELLQSAGIGVRNWVDVAQAAAQTGQVKGSPLPGMITKTCPSSISHSHNLGGKLSKTVPPLRLRRKAAADAFAGLRIYESLQAHGST